MKSISDISPHRCNKGQDKKNEEINFRKQKGEGQNYIRAVGCG
jgi:hypothetical protein